MSVTKACAWDLHPNQHTEVSPPQHAESLIATRPPEAGSVREERVLFPDERQLVAKQHFMPGGKYRCESRTSAPAMWIIWLTSVSDCEALPIV